MFRFGSVRFAEQLPEGGSHSDRPDQEEQTYLELIRQFEAQLDESYNKEAWKAEVFHVDAPVTGTKEVRVPNPVTGEIQTRTAQIIDGYVVIEGDMVLGTEAEVDRENDEVNTRGIVIDGFNNRWTFGIIPFEDFGSHPNSTRIREAMNEIQEKTNLTFVLRTNEALFLRVNTSSDDKGNYS